MDGTLDGFLDGILNRWLATASAALTVDADGPAGGGGSACLRYDGRVDGEVSEGGDSEEGWW